MFLFGKEWELDTEFLELYNGKIYFIGLDERFNQYIEFNQESCEFTYIHGTKRKTVTLTKVKFLLERKI